MTVDSVGVPSSPGAGVSPSSFAGGCHDLPKTPGTVSVLPGPHVDLAGGGAWRTMPSDAVGEAWASRRRGRRGIRVWDQVATYFA